jgi:FAD/FMN-containing dehydrogenase
MMPQGPSTMLGQLQQRLSADRIVTDPTQLEAVSIDHRRLYRGHALALALPRTVAEVSDLLTLCNALRIPVIPQGGNTGYCGGATPDTSGQQLVLSLRHLNRIRSVEPQNDSLVAEAGCILADVQRAAEQAGRFFPLSLGSQGSCQIGGNLSTNAGGLNVVRYGMTRDLVLGLEVVLADGRILSSLSPLRKDNTGYDLKQLFIGAEGTLGVITAASLKLFPPPDFAATALVAVQSVAAAIELLTQVKHDSGGQVSSFELLPVSALKLVQQFIHGAKLPLELNANWYVLLELTSSQAAYPITEILQKTLSTAIDKSWMSDAVIAQSERDRQNLWYLRETIPEAQRQAGESLKHDVSVSIDRLPDFLQAASQWVEQSVPEAILVCYGHAGDGNLHFNLSQKPGSEAGALLAQQDRVKRAIHDLVRTFDGSISAEHGIGQLKVGELERYGSQIKLDLMRQIKRSFDPNHILNPGKVLNV